MSKRSLTFLAALALAAASPAFATSVTVQVGDGEAVEIAQLGGTASEDGIIFWYLANGVDENQNPIPVDVNNPYTGIADITLTGFSAALKEDPFVTSVVSVINPTAFAQTYTFIVSLPIPAFAYNATVASSVGVTVTDTVSGLVSASSVAPTGIYTGTVNGSPTLTLLPDPTNVTCGSLGCSTTMPDNAGLPLLPAGPGVATSIGITLKFTLSAFDQAAITSRFEIVPEPTSVALLGVGLVALGIARRRAA